MILTDAGLDCLTDGRNTVFAWLWRLAGLALPAAQFAYQQEGPATRRATSLFQSAANDGVNMTGSANIEEPAGTSALTLDEQRARVVALRGLSQARLGEYEAAQATFSEAIRLDPGLDLSRLPSFWKLPRQAHEAVIAALYEQERSRDAASLIADLRTKYRPRLLPPRWAK